MQNLADSNYFTVWSDETNGIFSPAFFTQPAVEHKNTVPLLKLADINPNRKIEGLSNDTLVPYVGLPDTSNKTVNTVVERPYKEVRGRQIIYPGDILFARIEPSIFNKKYIYVDDLLGYEYAFTSTEFIVIRPKNECEPMYLFNLLFNEYVYSQVVGKTTGSTGRRRLEKAVLANLQIPIVSSDVQKTISSMILERNAAVNNLQNKINSEREKILSTFEDILGISKLEKQKADKWFGVWNDSIINRIDSSPYHPDRMNAIESVKSAHFPLEPLGEIVTFQKTQIKNLGDERYIGLENVESDSGQLLDSTQSKLSISSATVFHTGDILFAKLRPYLNKVHLAEFDGVCSTEFHVLSTRENILPEYLRAFLASELVVRQTSNLMTGNTLPRLQTEDVKSLLVPVPDLHIQKTLVEHIKVTESKIESLNTKIGEQDTKLQKDIDALIFG